MPKPLKTDDEAKSVRVLYIRRRGPVRLHYGKRPARGLTKPALFYYSQKGTGEMRRNYVAMKRRLGVAKMKKSEYRLGRQYRRKLYDAAYDLSKNLSRKHIPGGSNVQHARVAAPAPPGTTSPVSHVTAEMRANQS